MQNACSVIHYYTSNHEFTEYARYGLQRINNKLYILVQLIVSHDSQGSTTIQRER
jgi:hypothetical protein